jgi:hypothetical protein
MTRFAQLEIVPVQGTFVKPSKRTFSTTLVVQVTIEKISSVWMQERSSLSCSKIEHITQQSVGSASELENVSRSGSVVYVFVFTTKSSVIVPSSGPRSFDQLREPLLLLVFVQPVGTVALKHVSKTVFRDLKKYPNAVPHIALTCDHQKRCSTCTTHFSTGVAVQDTLPLVIRTITSLCFFQNLVRSRYS